MARARQRLGLVLIAAATFGCTPPHVDEGEHPVRKPTGASREGAAAAPAGVAFFASQDQMYKAFADLIAGTMSEGARAYSLSVGEGEESPDAQEAKRAYDRLTDLARRSNQEHATAEGKHLRRVEVDVKKVEERVFRVVVTSVVDERGQPRHRERREGVVRIDDSGKATLEWAGPPES